MQSTLAFEAFEQDGAFVAHCLDPDIASDGATREEAVANLREALSLYFEPIPTLHFNNNTQEKP